MELLVYVSSLLLSAYVGWFWTNRYWKAKTLEARSYEQFRRSYNQTRDDQIRAGYRRKWG